MTFVVTDRLAPAASIAVTVTRYVPAGTFPVVSFHVRVPFATSVACVDATTKDRLGTQVGVLLDDQEQALSDAIAAAFDLD